MDYDAVIFDNDGVLTTITDRDVLRTAIRDAFEAHGVHEPEPEDVDAMMDVTVADVKRRCAEYGIDPASFWQKRDGAAAEHQIGAIRDGEKTLYEDSQEIRRLDVPTGIVSNNQQRTVEFITDHFDLDWARAVSGREPTLEGVRRKKPEPYYLRRALADLGFDAGDRSASDAGDSPDTTAATSAAVLYVGDSPKDVVAAERVGIDAAFVRRSHREHTELPRTPAYETPDLAALIDRLVG